jgi:PAS domain-containing protein
MNITTSIKQLENFYEVVLNTVSDAVVVVDNDFRVKFQNRILTQLYGSKVGEHCYAVAERTHVKIAGFLKYSKTVKKEGG